MSQDKTSEKNWVVVNAGGKQQLATVGQKFETNRVTHKEGETFKVESVLDKTPVQIKVVKHFLGDKIRGLKFKNKVRYLRHYGHRQQLSLLEVVSVGETKEKTASAEKPTAVKKPAAKKTVAKVKNG